MSKIERMVTNFAVISAAPHSQHRPTPSLCCACSEPEVAERGLASGLVLSSGKGSVLPLEDATKSLVRSQVVLSDNTYAGHSSLLRSFEKSNFSRCQRKASPYF